MQKSRVRLHLRTLSFGRKRYDKHWFEPRLDDFPGEGEVEPMTATLELELKQRLSRLSEKDRRAMSAYLLRLKHESPAGRRQTSRIMRDMDSGKKTSLRELAKQLGHG